LDIQSTMSASDVQLSGPNGSSAVISPLGATVISFKGSDGVERFYRSSKEETASKGPQAGSIIGGAPIIWPAFADTLMKEPGFENVPFHGFANRVLWKHEKSSESSEAVFTLVPDEAIKKMFKQDFKLTYTVKLTSDSLDCTLKAENPSSSSTDLQYHICFHNYYLIPEGSSPAEVKIEKSLKGKSFIDKVDNYKVKTDSRDTFFYDGFTDSVYSDVPSSIHATFGNKGQAIHVDSENLDTLTTWNPAKTIDETEDGGWKKFVCIEPGSVNKLVAVKPGQSWTCRMHIQAK